MRLTEPTSIPDRFFKSDFAKHPERRRLLRRLRLYRGQVRLFPELLQKLQAERSARSFVAVDGGGHEDQVRAEQFSDERKRYGGGFVDDDELGLAKFVRIGGMDVLNKGGKNYEIEIAEQKIS